MAHAPGPAPRLSIDTLNPRIQQLGRELFQKCLSRKGKGGAWWSSKLMDFALQDEALKIQLFRFVDVLPTLRSGKEVGQHLKEYFDAPGQRFPGVLSWGASLASFSSLAAAASALAIRRSIEEMARTFIAGQNPAEALKQVEAFRKAGMSFTLDLLGEAVVSEAEADAYHAKYLEMLQAMARAEPSWKPDPRLDQGPRGPLPRVNLSVKLSALYSQLDPIAPQDGMTGILRRLVPLLQQAKARNAFVNLDMEDYRLKDLTLALFREVASQPDFRDWPGLGLVIQAYLKDSLQDIESLAAWAARRGAPTTVRLVKGAYWDYETVIARQQGWPCPVFTRKPETDANFEACLLRLLEAHPVLETAIASHNIRSLAVGMAAAEARGLSRQNYEIQALYGMAQPLQEALVESGCRVRVYMPFGALLPGMAYLVRRLLENTANESFLRQGLVEGVSAEQLLADPRTRGAATPATPVAAPAPPPFLNEPETPFFTASNRQLFAQALARVRQQLGRDHPLQIGGKPEEGGAGVLESRNPARRTELLGRVAAASPSQADRAVAAARAAFPAWRETPVQTRGQILRRAAGLIRARKFDCCAWLVLEAGKPWREADGDVAEAIDFLEYYAGQAEQLQTTKRICAVPGEINEELHQPRGVAAVIAPWNFPLAILAGMSAAALATGNTVVMKPAEQTPLTAVLLAGILTEAGIPPGVVNCLPGSGETVGARLVEHPEVNLIAFTGSQTVGLAINACAAQTRQGQQGVKKVICEMGGKNAILVDSDADLDEAVAGVVASAFGYAGQKCSACSRAIVIGSAYAPFRERLLEAAACLKVGPPEDPGCRVPPVIDDQARERLLRMIETGKGEANLALQVDVTALAQQGSYVGPTVFTEVPPGARIAQEELFGPVLCLLQAADFEEALRIALDVPFALTGGIYSRSPAHIALAREQFRVGNLYINRGITGAKVYRQPFGGFKMSGIGSKAGGARYLDQFVEPRTITENTLRRGFAPES